MCSIVASGMGSVEEVSTPTARRIESVAGRLLQAVVIVGQRHDQAQSGLLTGICASDRVAKLGQRPGRPLGDPEPSLASMLASMLASACGLSTVASNAPSPSAMVT